MVPSDWANFYVIVGSASAALTGLQFVVVALSANTRRIGSGTEVGVFATPTIFHFSSVLLVAAILSVPHHTPLSLAICLGLGGAVGLVYAVMIAMAARREELVYQPVLEDWIWHAALPVIAYAMLFIAGVCAGVHTSGALYVIAATVLLLLVIGIHNSWDAAVYIATSRNAE